MGGADAGAGETADVHRVLVVGATGRQGGAVARELLKRGYAVRGLTRSPVSDRARRMSSLGVE
ncbi:MAG: NAD-dependent epimerase/dehydratase family protein, partial [Gammaproteobacteria bacterium]